MALRTQKQISAEQRSTFRSQLHHSDHGNTYTSESFLAPLRALRFNREYERHGPRLVTMP